MTLEKTTLGELWEGDSFYLTPYARRYHVLCAEDGQIAFVNSNNSNDYHVGKPNKKVWALKP